MHFWWIFVPKIINKLFMVLPNCFKEQPSIFPPQTMLNSCNFHVHLQHQHPLLFPISPCLCVFPTHHLPMPGSKQIRRPRIHPHPCVLWLSLEPSPSASSAAPNTISLPSSLLQAHLHLSSRLHQLHLLSVLQRHHHLR